LVHVRLKLRVALILLRNPYSDSDSYMPRFQLQGKKFFLTFPQNTTAKETALANIKLHLPEYLWVMISQEKHQDGETHLHIGIEFKEKLRTRKVDYFDCIASKHGNYQTMRSAAGTVEYLKKEDPEPLCDGAVPSESKQKVKTTDTIANKLDAGATLEEIRSEYPGFFMMHKRKIEELEGYIAMKRMKTNLEPFPGRFMYAGSSLDTATITDWLNSNVATDVPRPFKSAQLYIHGPRNSRKTSLITYLSKWFRIYWVPKDELFYCDYDDNEYDIIVFDEFRMQKNLQWLNSFIEGAPVLVRKKGTKGIMKRKNLPVVFLSNYSYETMIADPDERALFDCRVKTVTLTSPIDLDNLLAEPVTVPVTPESASPEYNFTFPELGINELYCDESLD